MAAISTALKRLGAKRMGLRMEIRAALATGNKDAVQLLAVCPSAKSIAQLTNNLHQLAHEGKILCAEEKRLYMRTRESDRTRKHDYVREYSVWILGKWPDPDAIPQRPAENMPNWLMSAKQRRAR